MHLEELFTGTDTAFSAKTGTIKDRNGMDLTEAEEYLNGELYKDLISYSTMSVLGLFSPTMTRGKWNSTFKLYNV